ncbi:biliverdin-producing heme oxygenase [Sphingomonas psychrolutea]|uniref:biliverdin-producing heme oxygenase n=1 Tax=Sphingomonas psychrolutea TaxID=1259676 RepID=UPI0016687490|nr:biliverdin-producing heme oxygenase [Sphingomonas psychrolutea]
MRTARFGAFVTRSHATILECTARSAWPPAANLHDALRAATSTIHERLHHHPGLAAVQSGTIGKAAYTALLCRLYGFHQPFERTRKLSPERTNWLNRDLIDLGVDPTALAALPRAAAFPVNASPDYLLSARYVVEGSALGGRGLARQLDGLLGSGVTAGRRFFTGHGAQTGAVWRAYLDQVSRVPPGPSTRTAVVAGATDTFAIFEQWLEGWNDRHD